MDALINAINTFDFTRSENEDKEDDDTVNKESDGESDNDNCSDKDDGDEVNAGDLQIESQLSSHDAAEFETPRKELPVLKRARDDD